MSTDLMGNTIEKLVDSIEELPDINDFIGGDEEVVDEDKLNRLEFEQVRHVLMGAQGKVLTIIDAVFTDEKRLKYVKDLVREAFSNQCDWAFELSFRDFERTEKVGEYDCKNGCGAKFVISGPSIPDICPDCQDKK